MNQTVEAKALTDGEVIDLEGCPYLSGNDKDLAKLKYVKIVDRERTGPEICRIKAEETNGMGTIDVHLPHDYPVRVEE